MRAVGYGRASTTEQVEDGQTLDAQEHAIVEFCRARGWALVEIYVDPGLSAFRQLRDLGVSFSSISENPDLTTPWGKLALAVLGTMVEIYLDKLRFETSRGKKARARKGLPNGMPPLGHCRGNYAAFNDPNGEGYCPGYGQPSLSPAGPADPWVAHPIEQAAVRLAFSRYATGEYSHGDIADLLAEHVHVDEDGHAVRFRTKGRRGRGGPGRFNKDSIRDLLQNVHSTGQVPYYGATNGHRRKRDPVTVYPGQHPALMGQELFDRCQEIRVLMRSHPRRAQDYMSKLYPLSGLLYCSQCHGPMRAQSGNGVRYYQDKTRMLHTGDCDREMVKAQEVEVQVARYLMSFHLPPNRREEVLAELYSPEDRAAMAKKEQELQGRLARLVELYLAGGIGRGRHLGEKAAAQVTLTSFHTLPNDAILAAGSYLLDSGHSWLQAHSFKKSTTAASCGRSSLCPWMIAYGSSAY